MNGLKKSEELGPKIQEVREQLRKQCGQVEKDVMELLIIVTKFMDYLDKLAKEIELNEQNPA